MLSAPDIRGGGRVLTVDDSPVIRELLTIYLEAAGHTVVAAQSGEEALRVASSMALDAVILDVNLPGISGVVVGAALRDNPVTSSLVIAMHTSEPEDVVRTVFGEYDVFLPKPCEPVLLSTSIARLLELRYQGAKSAVDPSGRSGSSGPAAVQE